MRHALFCAAFLAAAPALAQTQVVQAEQQFAVDVYGKLAATPGNFVVSPYSVASALGMVYAGAKGTTAAQMAAALHVQGMSLAAFEAQSKTPVMQSWPGATVQLDTANAAWLAKGFPYHAGYLAVVRNDFAANLRETDFAQSDAASDAINAWVAQHTAQKITQLVTPDMFNAHTALVVTNAVYFKGAWAQAFNTADTRPQTFHLAPGNDEQVPMMHQENSFPITQADGAEILALPYTGDASMVIILPDAPFGLSALEAQLSATKLDNWLAHGQSALVDVSLPKFSAASGEDMGALLQSLGITAAFDPHQADFSGIGVKPGYLLFIGDVVHKARIDVDEKSTEAEAATAVVMVGEAAMEPVTPPAPIPFVADHPFLYLIRANSSGAILFMGRVDDPTKN
jgi:serpin B